MIWRLNHGDDVAKVETNPTVFHPRSSASTLHNVPTEGPGRRGGPDRSRWAYGLHLVPDYQKGNHDREGVSTMRHNELQRLG